ncbi:tetratricopeptide repeat protein [Streptomyces sp. NPDC057257]|uniref:AfsR/SARP family transcriptional regulator n=1 Tax=Streptomyces sp. NPDC057257 TaxID=3346071 RepID=UPI00363681C8
MELLALGPLELWHDGRQYGLGSLQERRVLLILIHARCEPVSVDTLTDRVWNGEPPPTAVETLQSYLSRLRGRLRGAVGDEQAWVGRVSPRLYQLRAADAEDIDLLRFQRLRTDAAAAAGRGEHELAIGLLRTAESMWRGEPLREFGDNDWAASARSRLVEDHRRVREERIGLEMELGRHDDLVGELRELASQNPFAQKVLASLMLALYRCGRHDEALAVYRDLRGRLHETQGIEPGAELQELHLRMLEQDRTLMRTRGPAEAVAPAGSEPRNCLPRDTADFTGRVGELRILLARENDPAGPPGEANPLPVTVLHGMPGIGKTALAVRAAHRLRAAYPDGQFYVDLRGYSSEQPLDPAEALALLLHSAGWSGELPATPDERAARWREWTARHRAVVLLDNARDAAQVAPLLPGTPACRAIVTTRSRLAGLDGATFLRVDALSRAEAKALFTRIVGSSRTSAEPEALERVVDASACHPLALQLLASRFRHRESWVLQDLLDRLAHAADPLAEFDDQVRAAFQVSYAELGTAARTLLRRLALHPGPDITLAAAAALAGPEFEETPGLLAGCVEELLDASLLEDQVRGRYRLHDLTRAFGLRAATPADQEVLTRLLAHHLAAAHQADCTVHPHRRTIGLPPDQSRHVPHFADADEASVWLTVERANLLAVARTAAARHPEYAAFFPAVLARSLKLWGIWDITTDLFDAALPALRTSGDRAALAHTLTAHADLLAQRDHAEALRRATEALSLYEDLHDTHGCADALLQSGRAHLAAGQGGRAMHDLDRSLTLYREARDRSGEAECLNVQGAVMYYAGQYDEALDRVQRMQTIYEELPDPYGLAQALNNRGELASLQGRHADARVCYERSLTLMREHGGPQDLAILATNLGAVHQATGRTDLALSYYRRALDAHRSSGDILGEADALIRLGLAHSQSGRRGEALLHLTMAEQVATSIDNPFERLRALLGRADVQRESGRMDIAFRGYKEALAVARGIDVPLGTAQALDGLARTTRSTQEAHTYGEQAVTLYRGLGADTEADQLLKLLTGHKSTGS